MKLTVASLMLKTRVWLMKNVLVLPFHKTIVSSRVSAPPWNIHFTSFYLGPSYEIFVENFKITFRKSLAPPDPLPILWINPTFVFTHSPTKNSKSTSPPILPTLQIFQAPPAERGSWGVGRLEDTAFFK